MPKVDPSIFGRHQRSDGEPGFEDVIPTNWKYGEADSSDVRVYRVRVYNGIGNMEHSYLRNTMGRRFVDNMPDIEDDFEYLASLRPNTPEKR